MTPNFYMSVQLIRPVPNVQGALTYPSPFATISGSVWRTKDKELTTSEGEVKVTDAQGFFAKSARLELGDHVLVVAPAAMSGERFQVVSVVSGHNHRGAVDHGGALLKAVRDAG